MLTQIEVKTTAHACLADITDQVEQVVARSGVRDGVCYLFIPHTTAALTINENADPTVKADILKELDKIVPWTDHYAHSEGNSAAHIKASLMGFSHFVLVADGRIRLGTWQGIFLAEFDGPRNRIVWIKVLGPTN
jgi:secondary thiamine-phosphate synthase enzyme